MKNNFFSALAERIRMEGKHLGILILDIAILVMCVVFVRSVVTAGRSFHEAREEGYDLDILYYRLEEGNYAQLANLTWQNRMYGREDDEDSQEYYAVADYYEAAVQYRICKESGDSGGAADWYGKMADAESRMGVFMAEKEKINRILGIQ